MPALRRVRCLDDSAALMVSDAAKNNLLGHFDSLGRSPFERMKSTCKINSGAENIAYGFMSARHALLQLIVDDGSADRSHRQSVFSNYTQVGVSSGSFPTYLNIVVFDFLY